MRYHQFHDVIFSVLTTYLIIMIVTVINMSSSYQHGMTTLISSGVSYTEKIVNHWTERERLMNGAHHIDEFVKFMNYAIRCGREKLHWLIVTWHCGIFLENNKIYWKCHINLTKKRSSIWVNDRYLSLWREIFKKIYETCHRHVRKILPRNCMANT